MGVALDLIKQLKVVEFEWKETDQTDIGLIAEKVDKIIPQAVWKDKGKIMGLKPLTLIAILVKAIQELEGGKK
jgi:hypothetical protein